MKRCNLFVSIFVVLNILVFTTGIALSQDKSPTRAQAQELLKQAITYTKSVGCEKAFTEFSNPKSKFNTAYPMTHMTAGERSGTTLAHGNMSAAIGKNFIDVKDAEGKPFVKMIMENLKKSNHSEIDYKWYHTASQKVVTRHQMTEVFNCGGSRGEVAFSVVY